jgi:two-component system response regulator NreC
MAWDIISRDIWDKKNVMKTNTDDISAEFQEIYNHPEFKKITLVIPDFSDLFCMSIRFLIQGFSDMQVIVTGWEEMKSFLSSGGEFIIIARCSWIKRTYLQEIKTLIESDDHIRVLLYLKQDEFHWASGLFGMGIHGFFSDSITKEEFHYCLNELRNGRSYFSQDIIPGLLGKDEHLQNGHNNHVSLTRRELEILELIVKGYTNKEIAGKLFLSPRTIEGHRAKLIMKYNVKNTAELIAETMKVIDLTS